MTATEAEREALRRSLAERMAAATAQAMAERERLEREPETRGWDGLDLISMAGDRIIGATVWEKPPNEHLEPKRGGLVVYFDDEGVRTIQLGRRWGHLAVMREDFIEYHDIDPRQTKPGTILRRHQLARELMRVIVEGDPKDRHMVGEYERRLIGFASALTAPEAPAR